MNARKIVQTFNGRNEWNIGGAGYFKLLSSVTPVDLELYSRTAQVLSADDIEAGFYLKAPFERVVISVPVNQEVTWLFAPDEGGSDRLAGEVSVVDGELSRVKARVCFSGFGSQVAVAAQYSHAQLWNPVGSGKRVIVEQFYMNRGGSNGQINVWQHNAALATLSPYKANKYAGGAAPVAEVRTGTNAAALGTSLILQWTVVANDTRGMITYKKPLILPPGQGMVIQATTVNISLEGGFEWFEEDDV